MEEHNKEAREDVVS